MVRKNKKFSKRLRNSWLLPMGILAIGGAAGAWWNYSHDKNANQTPATTVGPKEPAAATTTPNKNPAASGGVTQGGGTDKNGLAPAPTTDSSQWVTSTSGAITVQQPVNKSTLKSGDYLYGRAKVSKVHYRLIDNSVGKIAEGDLSVSGGKFSGILMFKPHGNSGELDVFSYNSIGAEINEVQISVNL